MPTSRRHLAKTFVDELLAAKGAAAQNRLKRSLGAYVIEQKQEHQLDMLLSDITKELATRGHVVAHVTTARALSATQRQEVTKMIKDTTGARAVELLEHVDASTIGGIRLSLPGRELDATIKQRIRQLQA